MSTDALPEFRPLEDDVARLRPLEESDLGTTVAWRNDPAIRDQVLSFRFPVTHAMEAQFIARAIKGEGTLQCVAGIVDKADNALCGLVYLRDIDWISRNACFGMMIGRRDRQRRGLGRSALDLMLHQAFNVLNLEARLSLCRRVQSAGPPALRDGRLHLRRRPPPPRGAGGTLLRPVADGPSLQRVPRHSQRKERSMNDTPFRRIPFFRHDLGRPEIEMLEEVFRGEILTTGEYVARFEKRFSELMQCKHALAVSSCTGGLHLSLIALGIGPGDEVITTPMTFIATATSILEAGATPVFVDVEEATGNIDADLVEAAITPRTKAIMPVHLYGLMCDMRAAADNRGQARPEDRRGLSALRRGRTRRGPARPARRHCLLQFLRDKEPDLR